MAGLRTNLFLPGIALLLLLCCPAISSAEALATAPTLLTPGQAAPVCILNATDNVEHKFPTAGSWNMIFFWSLFCHSCLEEMPFVQARLAEYGENAPAAFFVSLDTARMQKALINFCRLRDLKQPVLMERIASDSFETADKWGVVMTPSVFIVAPDGKVAWSHQGPLDIDRFFADYQSMSQALASATCTSEGR